MPIVPEDLHKCAAPHCRSMLPANLLMCAEHYQSLPSKVRSALFYHYRKGQECGSVPKTEKYMDAVRLAIQHTIDRHEEWQRLYPEAVAR